MTTYTVNDLEDVSNHLISRLCSLQNAISASRAYLIDTNSSLYDIDDVKRIEYLHKEYSNIIYDLLLIGLGQCPSPNILTKLLEFINNDGEVGR